MNGMGVNSSQRLDWLDALRGWAIFAVVVVHCGQVAYSGGLIGKIAEAGQYGVQLFFVVSALTISLTYDSHVAKYGSSWNVKAGWLIKRFFRIAPLYYLAAVLYPIEAYLLYVGTHHTYGRIFGILPWLSNILFVHTWVPSGNNSVVPGGWSIGVEMFFYLLVPLIWMISRKLRLWLLGAGVIVGIATTLIVAKIITGSFFVEDNTFLYYWFPTQAPVFALGIMFFMFGFPNSGNRLSEFQRTCCVAVALVIIVAGVYIGTWAHVAPVFTPTVISIGFFVVIASLGGWTKAALVNRPIVYLGQISYSVYIIHFGVLDVIHVALYKFFGAHYGPVWIGPIIAVALIGSCCIAIMSKRFVEDPAIQVGAKLCNVVVTHATSIRPMKVSGI